MFDRLATAKGQWKPQELWISPLEFDRSLSDLRSRAHSQLHCAEFVFLCLQLKKSQSSNDRNFWGEIELASSELTICNSKAGLNLRGVLAHCVINVVFFVRWVVISRYPLSKTESGHHKPGFLQMPSKSCDWCSLG